MRATVAFEHDGEKLRAGQAFSCTPVQAAALRYQRKATFIDGVTHQREMSARSQQEDDGEREVVTAGAGDDAPSEARVGRRGGRGSYRRTDLRAEESDKG